MGFRNLQFKRVYAPSKQQSALREFLIPALGEAVTYDRVSGYFSSESLAQTAPGIAPLVEKGGLIRLITSHHLVGKDFETFTSSDTSDSIIDKLAIEFERAASDSWQDLSERIKADYVKAMCWLLREGHLEIKFVIPESPSSLSWEKFHAKFGVLRDQHGDIIVFSGSINETSLGWEGNLENLDTKPLWKEGFEEYAEYLENFESLWRGDAPNGWATVDLPEALRLRLIQLAPEGEFPGVPNLPRVDQPSSSQLPIRKPRQYQEEAVQAWIAHDRQGLLEMATGTGKTFTAKLCLDEAKELGSLLTVLVTPYQHISDQWAIELKDSFPVQIGLRGGWVEQLQNLIVESQLGLQQHLVLIAVKNTASSKRFVDLTTRLSQEFDNFLFIGDEVHWLGAQTFQNALNPSSNFRLGLSATPKRYMDEEGTRVLGAYFGDEPVYEFGLKKALEWPDPVTGEIGVLTPYSYHPIFVHLTADEEQSWKDLTRRIQILLQKEGKTRREQEDLESLQIKRADIAKLASAKIPALQALLQNLGSNLKQTLIYSADTKQMEAAMEVARSMGIDTGCRITASEDASPSKAFGGKSERQHLLERFASGHHAVIFAMAALDEGVDIPSAEVGIILASSGNEKEFIQRRGRLMRKFPGKESAKIFDFVVLPPPEKFESLRKKELTRATEFGELALNSDEIMATVKSKLGDLEND